MRYHAPCVLNLSTGEITELRVYQSHPELVGELTDEQQGGHIDFQFGHGIEIISSIDAQSAKARVQKSSVDLNPALYCHSCREFLLPVATEGYVLLDLYAPDGLDAFNLERDANHTIRDYDVAVTEEDKEYIIIVSAHLIDGP